MIKHKPYSMEFHVSRTARDNYQFDQSLFSFNGNVIFANFHAARLFAQKMNKRRDLLNYPETAVRAGQINALGLVDEIMHLVVEEYRRQRNPNILREAVVWLEAYIGPDQLNNLLVRFLSEFPPLAVYRREISLDDYLESSSVTPSGEEIPNRLIALEELIMLWLTNVNPATSPYRELFDDQYLDRETSYLEVMDSLYNFFETQPPFGPDYQNLIDMLRAPAKAEPHSLTAQLEYIRTRWGYLLGKYLYRLLSSLDLIKEEEKAIFGVGGGGPSYVYDFGEIAFEPERFSQDREWMPNLVLIAKNTYVWLDQLSKKYKRDISRLDQIPNEELEILARWGFSGLWLIGLWERSIASRTIKQMRGNPEAVASAYSLFSYEIAGDLGGDAAYQVLQTRAWDYGIRLASDMVPNHMGIDSRWLVEHPDWFIALDYSPFPSYSFNGPNLSWDERVGIYIEDHYFDNTDAAVVFKRVDFWANSDKYIYHGNDGTSMPWNDTAQLNYLLPEVREAVIQTILHVARKFPIIRFDAAMTLAKKHYQRLWFPEPGSGGDIPSRAEHGLTREQFDAAFPTEFWREVVDRVAQEVPDTLLLAEAFWLMEGYFVRTLGMHRVYNSAFMNMLRDEKNQEYRLVIKNTLEFDPEILKRYVNFMNNPDERTAVDQFGKGDKYIGICVMMATMPGLPMFGHGQIEGFTEKYGMEYRVAYWNETPDGYLVERHEREIFPLLHRRWMFSDVENFLLYDFYTTDGYVNEDVYAFSNRAGDARSLVVYHNKYAETKGWIRISAAYLNKSGGERKLVQNNLAQGLALSSEPDVYIVYRDHMDGLEYIRSARQIHENGLYIELRAYQSRVLLDFRQIQENEWGHYGQLNHYLNGRGVPSIDEALKELYLQPVHHAFRQLVNPGMFQWLIDNRWTPTNEPETFKDALDEYQSKSLELLKAVQSFTGEGGSPGSYEHITQIAAGMRAEMETALRLPSLDMGADASTSGAFSKAIDYLRDGPPQKGETGAASPLVAGDPHTWGILFSYLVTRNIGRVVIQSKSTPGNLVDDQAAGISRAWIDEWLLGRIIHDTLVGLGIDPAISGSSVRLVKLLVQQAHWYLTAADQELDLNRLLKDWFVDQELAAYLGVNRYQDTLWFSKEAFETWMWWAYAINILQDLVKEEGMTALSQTLPESYRLVETFLAAERASGYKVERLLEAVD